MVSMQVAFREEGKVTYCEQVDSRKLRFIDVRFHLVDPDLDIRRQGRVDILQILPLVDDCVVEGK